MGRTPNPQGARHDERGWDLQLGRYLADKSAFEQQRHSDAAAGLLSALAADGALFITEIVALELLYLARSSDDHDVRREDLLSLTWLHLTQAVRGAGALDPAGAGRRGQHRRPIPAFPVAATHPRTRCRGAPYDRNVDLITGGDRPLGSLGRP